MLTFDRFAEIMLAVFAQSRLPKPLHLLPAWKVITPEKTIGQISRELGTSAKMITNLRESAEPFRTLLGLEEPDLTESEFRRSRQILGQLVLGRCAELAFEEIYRTEMQTKELELRDLRENRTDTDYRLHNGLGRPIYRINIKFHGARFRRAKELVGIEAEDCFPLATYKICSALQKQEQEGLPYFFAIVGVPLLSGDVVGAALPEELILANGIYHKSARAANKRDVEDQIVDFLIRNEHEVCSSTLAMIKNASWYMISARRADKLLRQLLFERVYALKIRGFAQQFRGAELDMHFSLKNDLIELKKFLLILKESGQVKITTLMERGDL